MTAAALAAVRPSVVIDTLLARVYLDGEHAYKVRRPLRTAFADQRTGAQRRRLAEEEVRLNQELAPGVHLGVLAVVDRDGELVLVPAAEAGDDALDHVVQMRQLDPAHALPALLEAGAVGDTHARALGARLAAFHRGATPVAGTALAFERTVAQNLGELAEAAAGLDLALDDLRALLADGLAAARPALRERELRGLAVDGHGDLRAEHVYVEGDRLLVIDRLEFDAGLRAGDVGADLAFLLMDLGRLGAAAFGAAVLDGYRAAGGDPGDDGLLALFAAHRALVRAKVALLGAGVHAQDPAAARATALAHLRLAERSAWRATWGGGAVVLCGPPGCGKSTLAAELAARTGWPVVSSDAVRKERAGLAVTARAPGQVYDPARTLEVYRVLGERAAAHLAQGPGVIVDATCSRRRWREALAEALDAPARFVQLVVPAGERERRAAARLRDPERVSDAGPDVAARLAAAFEDLDEVAPADHVLLRADVPAAALVERLARWSPAARPAG